LCVVFSKEFNWTLSEINALTDEQIGLYMERLTELKNPKKEEEVSSMEFEARFMSKLKRKN
jgi:hypothetical protein